MHTQSELKNVISMLEFRWAPGSNFEKMAEISPIAV